VVTTLPDVLEDLTRPSLRAEPDAFGAPAPSRYAGKPGAGTRVSDRPDDLLEGKLGMSPVVVLVGSARRSWMTGGARLSKARFSLTPVPESPEDRPRTGDR
jgi:hypothetical protein